ncbi:994_t:CDS:2 [Racocetra fulgida]|uniref:994_t:CDS:1 n=1 Tax=Racocetra fulgida TaxID=60492 RepID=A0A9N9A4X2_9GLOM|nr:994_t:CDS:2 [Racocetra fulgida]
MGRIWKVPIFIGIKVKINIKPNTPAINDSHKDNIVPETKPTKMSIPETLACLRMIKLRITETIGGIPDMTNAQIVGIYFERIKYRRIGKPISTNISNKGNNIFILFLLFFGAELVLSVEGANGSDVDEGTGGSTADEEVESLNGRAT